MANIFKPEPITYGDYNAWGPKELAQNEPMTGVLTSKLYLDGLDLKLSVGSIGLNNGSSIGICKIDTVTTISLAGLTISEWAKVEMSVVGTTVVLAITSMGITTPHILPTAFTGSFDGTKGAYHIVATKRCLGIVFINSAGACAGIVNPMSFIDAYDGYSTSNDGLGFYYYFSKNVQSSKPVKVQKAFILDTTLPDLQEDTELVASLMGGRRATLPTLADNIGRVITLWKLEDNQWWSEVAGEGAETINGDNIYYLRRVNDYITVVGETTGWHIIANGAPKILDSGLIRRDDWTNVHSGTVNAVHTDALGGTLTAANIINKKVTGGTTGTYGWVTGYAAGTKTIYLRDVVCTDTRVFDATENLAVTDVATTLMDTLSFAAVDWLNQDSNFWHGFLCDLEKIEIDFYISSDGSAVNTVKVGHVGYVGGAGSMYGMTEYAVDTNQVLLQLAANGWIYASTAGAVVGIDTEAYWYKAVAKKRG